AARPRSSRRSRAVAKKKKQSMEQPSDAILVEQDDPTVDAMPAPEQPTEQAMNDAAGEDMTPMYERLSAVRETERMEAELAKLLAPPPQQRPDKDSGMSLSDLVTGEGGQNDDEG